MWNKQGPWGTGEVYYMKNHLDVLIPKIGFENALEEVSRRLGRKVEDIKGKYQRLQQKNCHRAG
jgi:hypothetical protein